NQTWNVPSDWNSANNTIECIGSGGSGFQGSASVAPGGGGGAYAAISNLTLTPGGTATYSIGASATSAVVTTSVAQARETYFNGTASSSASLTCDWGRMGGIGTDLTTRWGGTTTQSIGTTKFSGGDGGQVSSGGTGSGGGGSAGPSGVGKNGGPSST